MASDDTDQLRRSFDDAPVIETESGYHYVVHPINNGVPTLEPALLREVVVIRETHTDSAMDARGHAVKSLVDSELVDGKVVVRGDYRDRD